MNVFLAGTPVIIAVPLEDKSGNALEVSSLTYRVIDQDGVEVMAPSLLVDFMPASSIASVAIPAENNTLALGATRELRSVELSCLVGGNAVTIARSYVVEIADPLQVGVNSFQTYIQAEFTSLSVPNTPGWDGASLQDRIAALIDARSHICQLNFLNVGFGQDDLSHAQAGISSLEGGLSFLTPEQFTQLPFNFRGALKLGQVAEADVILGGDPVEARRREGLMLESVGESKQMFRPGKPLQLPVSRRALAYMGQFVSFSRRIGRGS